MKVSVIVPTHNRAEALEKTLHYLSQQVFEHLWEVVVVNNNCTDNTDEVVEKAIKNFPVSLKLVHEKKTRCFCREKCGSKCRPW